MLGGAVDDGAGEDDVGEDGASAGVVLATGGVLDVLCDVQPAAASATSSTAAGRILTTSR
jgi:hypothetical protein